MPNIINPTKLPIFSTTQLRFLLKHQSNPISTSSLPTHEHIVHLILDQKSPTQALQTFKWASTYPHFTHNQATYRALIHKLCSFRRFQTVHQVLEEMPDSIGSPPDEDIFVTIVRGLGRARMHHQATKVMSKGSGGDGPGDDGGDGVIRVTRMMVLVNSSAQATESFGSRGDCEEEGIERAW